MIQLQEDFLTKFDRNEDMVVFLFLLFNADDEGKVIASLRQISVGTRLSLQVVRTSINKLLLTHFLTQKLTQQLTHPNKDLFICNYGSYNKKKKVANTATNTLSNTLSNTDKNDKELQFRERMKSRFPNVAKMDKKLTLEQYNSLLTEYPNEVILETLLEMENWKPLCVKNKSAYLTLNKWLQMRNGRLQQ